MYFELDQVRYAFQVPKLVLQVKCLTQTLVLQLTEKLILGTE